MGAPGLSALGQWLLPRLPPWDWSPGPKTKVSPAPSSGCVTQIRGTLPACGEFPDLLPACVHFRGGGPGPPASSLTQDCGFFHTCPAFLASLPKRRSQACLLIVSCVCGHLFPSGGLLECCSAASNPSFQRWLQTGCHRLPLLLLNDLVQRAQAGRRASPRAPAPEPCLSLPPPSPELASN